MNPTDAQWWWDIALDGIVGAVLTGLIAGAALWATIRHERRLAREAELRASVRELRRAGMRAALSVPEDRTDEGAWASWATDFLDVLEDGRGLSERLAPVLFADLQSANDWLVTLLEEVRDGDEGPSTPRNLAAGYQLGRAVSHAASAWLSNPTSYERQL